MPQIHDTDEMMKYLLPKLTDILFIAVFISVIGYGPRLLNVDGDLGRHLTIGGYILDTQTIPTRDVFSHTLAGEPLTPHEWLAQVVFALAYRLAGLDGVVFFCALLIAAVFTLVYRQSLARSGVLTAMGWVLLATAAASLHWLARPHLWTMLLVALWMGALRRLKAGDSKMWWTLPLLMLLWVNLHGAFIAGFVLWAAFAAQAFLLLVAGGTRDTSNGDGGEPNYGPPFWFAGVTALLATGLNPVGFRIWETSLGYLRNRYLVGHTAEYLPPDFHAPSTWPFLLMVALSLFVLAVSQRGKALQLPDALLLAGWTAMALYSTRNIPLYAIVVAPLLAEVTATGLRSLPAMGWFTRLEDRLWTVESGLRGWAWPAGVVLLVGVAFAGGGKLDFGQQGNRFDPAVFPVEAVDWLQDHPQAGKVFNHFPWGGYLLYREWPRVRVFIDGQTDFYGEGLTRTYEQVITLDAGWEGVLTRYGVDWAILPPGSPLAEALGDRLGWEAVYVDQTAAILVRR